MIVRFPNQGRQVDDLDIWSHTNDTIGSVRRGILNRIKANAAHTKIELFIGGEVVDPADDRKLIGQLNLKDKTVSAPTWLSVEDGTMGMEQHLWSSMYILYACIMYFWAGFV